MSKGPNVICIPYEDGTGRKSTFEMKWAKSRQHYSPKSKQPSKSDYPRSGNREKDMSHAYQTGN